MDELKLEKWRNDFRAKAENINIEFNAFFKGDKLEDYYSLKLNESDEYSIEVNDTLPPEIKKLLQLILVEAEPEDSV